jgi:DNA-binding GntR family transcriptional regulator
MTEPSAQRPLTTQEYVLAEVRRRIVNRDLKPGSPIRQEILAEGLGVSRVPVREALKILQGEGQVVYRPRRGYYVAELSLSDLTEVYRIRELLESEAARRAAELVSDHELAAIAQACRQVSRASRRGDVLAMTKANRDFHFQILAASQMPRLMNLVRVLWDATDTYRAVYYGDAENRDRVEHEHDAILDALRARDATQLVALLDEHRQHAVQALEVFVSPDAS